MKKLLLIPLAILLVTGCKSTLAPGAYNPSYTNSTGVVTHTPDIVFYTTDSAFDLAWRTLDTVFSIERTGRETFWKLSPDIKHTLDKLRPDAVNIWLAYAKARTAYIANPTPAGLTGLQALLAQIQQIATAVSAALPTGVTTATP